MTNPTTPSADYNQSCNCTHPFGGQKPYCPVHDPEPSVTTATASIATPSATAPDEGEMEHFDEFMITECTYDDRYETDIKNHPHEEYWSCRRCMARKLSSLQSRLKQAEAENKKLLEEHGRMRSWIEERYKWAKEDDNFVACVEEGQFEKLLSSLSNQYPSSI